MSQAPESEAAACREYELLMMRRLDGEITPAEQERLDRHLQSCPSCRKAFDEYSRLLTATAEVEMREVSQEEWDIYWSRVYNRLERGTAWVLVSIGAVIALAYAGFRFVTWLIGDPQMRLWAKAGVLVLAAGLALLFVSVLREKLTLRCKDRYRGVRR